MGLGLAEPGFATACYVEIEDYPRQTLIAGQQAGYLHTAPIWDDLKTFNALPWRGFIDTVLAGYPCQPFSQAGQRKGERDPRHLWPDIERIVDELAPSWCFFENVPGHLTLGLETVVRALQRMGFRVAVGTFSAAETGAAHERQRVFIVAYSCANGRKRSAEPHSEQIKSEQQSLGRGDLERRNLELADTDGGNTRPELAHACEPGPQGRERTGPFTERHGPETHGPVAEFCRPCVHPPGPADIDRWSAVLAMAPDLAPSVAFGDIARRANQLAQMVAQGELAETAAESHFRGMVDGLASRTRALRLLGNGVHPLAAGYAWRSLSAAHGLGSVDLGTAGREAAAATDDTVLRG